MPKEMHDKLAREAEKKGLKGKKKAAYIYGTLHKIEGGKKKKGTPVKPGGQPRDFA